MSAYDDDDGYDEMEEEMRRVEQLAAYTALPQWVRQAQQQPRGAPRVAERSKWDNSDDESSDDPDVAAVGHMVGQGDDEEPDEVIQVPVRGSTEAHELKKKSPTPPPAPRTSVLVATQPVQESVPPPPVAHVQEQLHTQTVSVEPAGAPPLVHTDRDQKPPVIEQVGVHPQPAGVAQPFHDPEKPIILPAMPPCQAQVAGTQRRERYAPYDAEHRPRRRYYSQSRYTWHENQQNIREATEEFLASLRNSTVYTQLRNFAGRVNKTLSDIIERDVFTIVRNRTRHYSFRDTILKERKKVIASKERVLSVALFQDLRAWAENNGQEFQQYFADEGKVLYSTLMQDLFKTYVNSNEFLNLAAVNDKKAKLAERCMQVAKKELGQKLEPYSESLRMVFQRNRDRLYDIYKLLHRLEHCLDEPVTHEETLEKLRTMPEVTADPELKDNYAASLNAASAAIIEEINVHVPMRKRPQSYHWLFAYPEPVFTKLFFDLALTETLRSKSLLSSSYFNQQRTQTQFNIMTLRLRRVFTRDPDLAHVLAKYGEAWAEGRTAYQTEFQRRKGGMSARQLLLEDDDDETTLAIAHRRRTNAQAAFV